MIEINYEGNRNLEMESVDVSFYLYAGLNDIHSSP